MGACIHDWRASGIAKGWCVDAIVETLNAAGFPDVYVDWGSDIRASGQVSFVDIVSRCHCLTTIVLMISDSIQLVGLGVALLFSHRHWRKCFNDGTIETEMKMKWWPIKRASGA